MGEEAHGYAGNLNTKVTTERSRAFNGDVSAVNRPGVAGPGGAAGRRR